MTDEEVSAYRQAFKHSATAWQSPEALELHGIRVQELLDASKEVTGGILAQNSLDELGIVMWTAAMLFRGFVAGYLVAKEEQVTI